jgi:hypothetical protein
MVTSDRQKSTPRWHRTLRRQRTSQPHPQVPAILLAYYQEDLISEDVIKSWGSKASKKYVDLATSKKVRKSAEILEWLETPRATRMMRTMMSNRLTVSGPRSVSRATGGCSLGQGVRLVPLWLGALDCCVSISSHFHACCFLPCMERTCSAPRH